MAVKIADIFAELFLKSDSYERGLSAAQGKASTFGNVIQGIFQGVGQRLFSGIVSGVDAFIGKMNNAVQASSNLSESVNQTGQIFGASAQKIIDFAGTADSALGQSKRQALDAASTFATFGKSAGLTGQALVDFSTKFVTLASDMASFKNTSPEEAITAIGAALRGESEPIRRYGVLLDEATLKHRALALGIISTTDQALTPQQKVLAATAEIYRQTGDIQGDFARTSEGLANAQRILAAEFENGSAKLGDTFRPAVESITNSLVGLAPTMFQYAQAAMDQFANGLAAGIRAILPVITTVRQLLAYWFAPGSPPRVAPDIDKWGAAAMGQFMKGFASVDFKGAIDTVGRALETILRSDVGAGKADENGLAGRVLGSRQAIQAAVNEFRQIGSVSQATIDRIARSAGSSGGAVASLVKSYFDLQKATNAVNRAQNQLNSITERYDAIISPLQNQLDGVRAEQQKLADQQRLIAARNVLNNFDSSAADKRAAQLEIEQISLEQQISTAEQKKKTETDAAQAGLDAAKKQQDAEKAKLDAAQATIDQQVAINNLLGEQRQLEERLAQQREADAKRAAAEAEQAANKAKRDAEEAQRLADQLHDAQLRYNLSLVDTAGKIRIMQGELANTKVGSVEYFNILTEISGLQQQYNRELEQAAKKAGAFASPEIATGIDGNITAPLGEASKAGENLASALKEAFAPIGPASQSTKDLADSIKNLTLAFGALFGIDFSTWNQSNQQAVDTTGWDHYGEVVAANTASAAQDADTAAQAMKKSADDTTLTLRTLKSDYKVIMDLIHGDWNQFWIDWQENVRLGQEAGNRYAADGENTWATRTKQWIADRLKDTGQWLADTSAAMGKWFTDEAAEIERMGKTFYDAGGKLLSGFWDGLKDKWGEVEQWFTDKLAALRAQLPFSEPKDPTSPLRGLAKSGQALMEMFQSGIDASPKLSIAGALPDGGLLAGATTNNTSNSTSNVFNFTINGANQQEAKDGVLEALRAAGLR